MKFIIDGEGVLFPHTQLGQAKLHKLALKSMTPLEAANAAKSKTHTSGQHTYLGNVKQVLEDPVTHIVIHVAPQESEILFPCQCLPACELVKFARVTG